METGRERFVLLAVAVALAFPPATVASPPACRRSDAAMVRDSDLVAVGEVAGSRLWRRGGARHLVATYRLTTVFKGEPPPEGEVIVTDTCLEAGGRSGGAGLGYPRSVPACGDGDGVSLPGVDPATGERLSGAGGAAELLLFLGRDERPGAPEVTWTELARTRHGGGCHVEPNELAPRDAEAYRRVESRRAAAPPEWRDRRRPWEDRSMREEREDFVELIRIREPARLGLYESLLNGAGIEYVVEGEAVQGLFPFASPGFFLGRGMGAVLRVRPEDLEDARRLLEEQVPLQDEDEEPSGG